MMPASSTPFMPGMMTSENTRSAENSSCGQDGKRGVRVGDAADRVAEIFQQLGGELPDVVIVLDHEHAIAAAARGRLAAGGGGLDRSAGTAACGR